MPRLAIKLSDRELQDANHWSRFITKGLYYFETHSVLPDIHEIYLLKPADEVQFFFLRDLILRDRNHQVRSLADGEFQYVFVVNLTDQLSMWLYAFKSIEVCAVTVGPECPADLKDALRQMEWTEPS